MLQKKSTHGMATQTSVIKESVKMQRSIPCALCQPSHTIIHCDWMAILIMTKRRTSNVFRPFSICCCDIQRQICKAAYDIPCSWKSAASHTLTCGNTLLITHINFALNYLDFYMQSSTPISQRPSN